MVMLVMATALLFLVVFVFIHLVLRLVAYFTENKDGGKKKNSKVKPYFESQSLKTGFPAMNGPPGKHKGRHEVYSQETFDLEEMQEKRWQGWSEIFDIDDLRLSTTHQRKASGFINIAAVDPEGRFIIIANASGVQPKDQNVSGWELIRRVDGKRERVFIFPPKTIIKANTSCKIWARGQGISSPPKSFVFEGDTTWGTGLVAETALLRGSEVQASLYWNTSSVAMETPSEIQIEAERLEQHLEE